MSQISSVWVPAHAANYMQQAAVKDVQRKEKLLATKMKEMTRLENATRKVTREVFDLRLELGIDKFADDAARTLLLLQKDTEVNTVDPIIPVPRRSLRLLK